MARDASRTNQARAAAVLLLAVAGVCAAESIGDLLGNAASNIYKIEASVLKTNKVAPSRMLDLVRARLATETDPVQKGALYYIAARTHFWAGNREAADTGNALAPQKHFRDILLNLLSAFEAVGPTQATGRPGFVRNTIAKDIKTVLASRHFAPALTDELKNEAILRFIDVVEANPDSFPPWNARHRGQVYQALGIPDRLLARLPAQIPTDVQELQTAMELAAAVDPEHALPYADALARRLDLTADGASVRGWDVFKVYRDAGSDRGVPWLKQLARQDGQFYLSLFNYSRDHEPGVTMETRGGYLQSYLDWAQAKHAESPGPKKLPVPYQVYNQAIDLLMEEKQYRYAVTHADRALEFSTDETPVPTLAAFYFKKGICHARLGEDGKAKAALNTCLAHAEKLPWGDRLQDAVKEELRAVEAGEAMEKENPAPAIQAEGQTAEEPWHPDTVQGPAPPWAAVMPVDGRKREFLLGTVVTVDAENNCLRVRPRTGPALTAPGNPDDAGLDVHYTETTICRKHGRAGFAIDQLRAGDNVRVVLHRRDGRRVADYVLATGP
jgi:tetratricopeptide (TPR) repeat protein